MKDLTHYFNPPKDENNSKSLCSSQILSSVDLAEKSPPYKKRKLSLSKSKSNNKSISKEVSVNICNSEIDSKAEDFNENSSSATSSKNKKRKHQQNTSGNKIEVSKSLKVRTKRSKKSEFDSIGGDDETIEVESRKEKKNKLSSVKNKQSDDKKVGIHSKQSDESCVQIEKNKHSQTISFSNSNGETRVNGKAIPEHPKSTTKPCLNYDNTLDPSKNKLFTYFNSTGDKKVNVCKSPTQSNENISLKLDCNSVENKDKINDKCGKDKSNLIKIKSKCPVDKQVNTFDSKLCDKPIIQKQKKKCVKVNLFSESDNEIPQKEEISMVLKPPTEKSVNNDKSPDSPRNSLFSYFNKVDKETALKQKPEKIKVEVLVHLPPSNEKKPTKHSSEKVPIRNKSKMRKNKIKLDNSDVIEIVCSEEIVDENSPANINIKASLKVEAQEDTILVEEETILDKEETILVKEDTILVEEENSLKNKQSNLASIFVSKKDKQNVTLRDAEADVPLDHANKETEYVEKQSKNRTKIQKQKKLNKSDKHCPSLKNNIKDVLSDSTQPLKKSRSKTIKAEIGANNKTLKQKLSGSFNNVVENEFQTSTETRSPSIKEDSSKAKENTLISPKISNQNQQGSCLITPNKNFSENNLTTPKQKSLSLNEYFTPKSENATSKRNYSGKKSCGSKSSSPWVMKVRLNSVTKPAPDSEEEDSRDSITDMRRSKSNLKTESEAKNFQTSEEKSDPSIDSKDSNQDVKKSKTNSKCESEAKVIQTSEKKDDSQIVVIDDDDEFSKTSQENKSKRKSLPRSAKKLLLTSSDEEKRPEPPVKLWPFFQKGGAQPPKEAPVDEAKLKAKIQFLESGVPEVIKRKVENVRNEMVVGQPAPFPTVSHVAQGDGWDRVDALQCRLPPPRTCKQPLQPPTAQWESLILKTDPEEQEIPVFKRVKNVKAFLEQLKEEEPKTEVKALYKKLKEYKNGADSSIWTDVYKPTKSVDMVGNSENIKKLKTWLETLKNRRKREGSESSGDEFVNDDSDGEHSTVNNMAVLTGPCGCGKTSAVYALANELDCKVLEINSSCNRSGKRILAEFSESTQSHHVERAQPLNGLFNSAKMVKMKKKKRSKLTSEAKAEKTSLILVEDADLLFPDMDEGFVPALASLAANSKRPLILVTNAQRTPHLERFNNTRLLRLDFARPKPAKLGLWLRLVGLVEGVMMTHEQASRLVDWSGCDVRRCLLQLQLMVHSNNAELVERLTESQLWWRWPARYELRYELPTLLEPEEAVEPQVSDKKELVQQLEAVADTTSRLSFLDVLSSRSMLNVYDTRDVCPVAWHRNCVDSTSLTPRSDVTAHATTRQLIDWLAHAASKDLPPDCTRIGQSAQEARWLLILRQAEQMFMSGVTTTQHSNHESIACDYMPTLRNLGRSEQQRLVNYTRRANRFFNYLQGLGIHAGKSYRDFMCDAFS